MQNKEPVNELSRKEEEEGEIRRVYVYINAAGRMFQEGQLRWMGSIHRKREDITE